jgi:hypothetical protein
MEKSLKNLISLFGEKPARGLPKPTPHPTTSRIRGKRADAGRGRKIQMRNWDVENGGGGNNAKRSHSSMGQHFDAGFQMKIVNTFLLLIALTKSAYLLLASMASKTRILYSESKAYKWSPSWQPALSRLHYIQQATPL